MSDKGSVFQKGGGGTNFEQYVQTSFITTLMIQGYAPCVPSSKIQEVVLQSTNRGWATDDILVISQSEFHTHQLLIQVKHNLVFSDNNDTFNEVISAYWTDFNNSSFNKETDRLVIIKNSLNNTEKNHIKGILNFAKTHSNEIDFYSETQRIKEKQDKLSIFEASLQKANNDIALTNLQVWQFLKSLDILGYDFMDQDSVDEVHFLNLIRLTKKNETSLTDKAIWDSILAYVSKLNPNGGSVTLEGLKSQDFFKYFNLDKFAPYVKSIEKLESDSALITKPIKNTVGTGNQIYHLDRAELISSLAASINTFQLSLINGKPGVGKTSLVIDTIRKEFSDASVFVFRADQFNQPHLANVFANLGVTEKIQDIFSCITSSSIKIIFIDSIEKLLEDIDPHNAFRQLLQLIKELPDVKLVCTTRNYAIDLLNQKFGIDEVANNRIQVELLNDSELEKIGIAIPALKEIISNKNIKELLRSPKYLDFVCKAIGKNEEDFSKSTLLDFKNRLWDLLVKDVVNRKDGLPARREDLFVQITVSRAKEMTLFTRVLNADESIIELLENDELIFQDGLNRKFSPAHDILEDWALVRYISLQFEKANNHTEFFNIIGGEPAIRRAFRLWIQDSLVTSSEPIMKLLLDSFNDTTIANYWSDEVLVAVFKSENSQIFFEKFKAQLLGNNSTLLLRCIHLIKTTCKESNSKLAESTILLPIGSGWPEIMKFIKENITSIDNLRYSIVGLLYDWEFKLLFGATTTIDEMEVVKDVVWHYLNQIESLNEFWDYRKMEKSISNLILMAFNLAPLCHQELTDLFHRANAAQNSKTDNWELNRYYEKVISKSLKGIHTSTLIHTLPELIVETAKANWKVVVRKPSPNSISGRLGLSSLHHDECYGIRDKSSFSPSGIYKTPVYWLLKYHPKIGLEFVIEFINYSVDFYVSADCEYKRPPESINFLIGDKVKKIWSSSELWNAFRGTSVTHYCLECILMSLEKVLLELASRQNQRSKELLQSYFDYLLENTNNVSVIAVLVSVAMAYPKELDEHLIKILGQKEFYLLDSNRRMSEHQAMSPMDDWISFAQLERHTSNQLEHRTKYYRGLIGFVTDYQFNVRTYNEELFVIFDRFKKELDSEDIIWEKTLTEIDARNHKIGEYDEELKGYPIAPIYTEKVSEMIDSGKDEIDEQNLLAKYSLQIGAVYENKSPLTLEEWTIIYTHYAKPDRHLHLFDKQITLAAVGLRDLNTVLTKPQKEWCIDVIVSAVHHIIKDALSHNYLGERHYNIVEKEVAIKAFHFVYLNLSKKADRQSIVFYSIYLLSCHFSDHEVDYITKYYRDVFFVHCIEAAKQIWYGLIKFSEFEKKHSDERFRNGYNEEYIQTYNHNIYKLISKLSKKAPPSTLDIPNFDALDIHSYTRAIRTTPFRINDKEINSVSSSFIPFILADLEKENDYSHRRDPEVKQIQHGDLFGLRKYYIDVVLFADLSTAKDVISNLLIENTSNDNLNRYYRDDKLEFIRRFFESIVFTFDKILSETKYADSVDNLSLVKRFWELWQHIFDIIKVNDRHGISNILLLGIDWRDTSENWMPLRHGEKIYEEIVKVFGERNLLPLIKFSSTAGSSILLPGALIWIVQIIKKEKIAEAALLDKHAEILIRRLYFKHIGNLKRSPESINAFIYLLDTMVNLGSSSAYLYRENVITYKAVIS